MDFLFENKNRYGMSDACLLDPKTRDPPVTYDYFKSMNTTWPKMAPVLIHVMSQYLKRPNKVVSAERPDVDVGVQHTKLTLVLCYLPVKNIMSAWNQKGILFRYLS